jgi:hypothetical protein
LWLSSGSKRTTTNFSPLSDARTFMVNGQFFNSVLRKNPEEYVNPTFVDSCGWINDLNQACATFPRANFTWRSYLQKNRYFHAISHGPHKIILRAACGPRAQVAQV